MPELFLPWTMLLAFVLASLVLAATPGPGVVFIVARTLSQGRSAGLASVAGVACGNFANAVGASLGLAALFAISSTAFTLVKWAGAAYLFYMGAKALLAKEPAHDGSAQFQAQQSAASIFRDGFWVALLNPKTAIFFAAFLPQFLDTLAPSVAHSLLLGAIFVLIAASTDTLYVLAAARVAPAMAGMLRGASIGRYLTATVFIGLGVFTALTGARSK